MNNGAALVSCFTTAFRYWSSVVFRHARSHDCADAMPVANAATKRKRAECIRKRTERIGETSAAHSAPICAMFARLLRLLVLQCARCSGPLDARRSRVLPNLFRQFGARGEIGSLATCFPIFPNQSSRFENQLAGK